MAAPYSLEHMHIATTSHCGLFTHDKHSKKEVTLTLLRLSQLQLSVTMSLPHWVSISLETESMCAMCRLTPEYKQSNVCYGIGT